MPGKQVAVTFHQLYPKNQPQLPKVRWYTRFSRWLNLNLTKGFISQIVQVCIQDEDVVEARKVLAQLQVGMRESWNWWENRSNQQNRL